MLGWRKIIARPLFFHFILGLQNFCWPNIKWKNSGLAMQDYFNPCRKRFLVGNRIPLNNKPKSESKLLKMALHVSPFYIFSNRTAKLKCCQLCFLTYCQLFDSPIILCIQYVVLEILSKNRKVVIFFYLLLKLLLIQLNHIKTQWAFST